MLTPPPAQTDQAGCGTPGRQTRVDSSLWPQSTVPKLPSGTNGCQTLKSGTLNTSYFCQKSPLCQPPPSPTPPPNSHFVRKVKLRLAYRLAFVKTRLSATWVFWNNFELAVETELPTHRAASDSHALTNKQASLPQSTSLLSPFLYVCMWCVQYNAM